MDKINFILSILLLLSLLFSCEDTLTTTQQVQLNEARQSLDYQKQQLDAVKAQYGRQQQLQIGYPGQVAVYNTRIQGFGDILQSLKTAEEDVNQATTAALRAQSSAAQIARDQIEPQISQLENEIFQTKQQMYVWTNTAFTLTPEQQILLVNLANSLQFQQQQLDFLKAERVNISAQILNQTRLIDSAFQNQKREITNEQTALQNEIFTLRSEIERLQKAYAQTRMSLIPLSQQLEQAQTLYDDQVKRVRELEAAMRPQ